MSILFALPGCVDPWRTKNHPDGTVKTEKDPKWAIAVTASALVVGLIANFFLFLRILGRINPKRMQYFSMTLWILEGMFILECLLKTFKLSWTLRQWEYMFEQRAMTGIGHMLKDFG